LYAAYARGTELRELVAVIGEAALTEADRKYLKFAEAFERRFVAQSRDEHRTVEDSLGIAWDLLSTIPFEDLKRIKPQFVEKYYPGRSQVSIAVREGTKAESEAETLAAEAAEAEEVEAASEKKTRVAAKAKPSKAKKGKAAGAAAGKAKRGKK